MNLRKRTVIWIGIGTLFLVFCAQAENFITALFSTAISVGLFYGVYMLLVKLFD